VAISFAVAIPTYEQPGDMTQALRVFTTSAARFETAGVPTERTHAYHKGA
jgi:hypothetical protein